MLNVLTTRIGPALRHIAGHLRDVARAVLGTRHPDPRPDLWQRRGLLRPAPVRVRRDLRGSER